MTRRYLMVTAGSVLIRSGEVPAHEVLLDLLELCKGVQHPTRGLFLRYFLVQSLKVRCVICPCMQCHYQCTSPSPSPSASPPPVQSPYPSNRSTLALQCTPPIVPSPLALQCTPPIVPSPLALQCTTPIVPSPLALQCTPPIVPSPRWLPQDKLPERERPDDALSFLVKALQETNSLWVRLQHQSPVTSVRRRESDRRDLRVLVG